jgi:hypothetical protein
MLARLKICIAGGGGAGRSAEVSSKGAGHILCFLANKTSEQLFQQKEPYLIFHEILKSVKKIKIS